MVIAALAAGVAGADITVRELPSGNTGHIPSTRIDDVVLASVPDFFERLGFTWQWDAESGRLTVRSGGERFVFIQDIAYFFHDSLLVTLRQPVVRIGPTLYLPFETLLEIGRGQGKCSFEWDAGALSLTIDTAMQSAAPTGSRTPAATVSPEGAVIGSIRTVVIDAGHGGFDPGALGPGGVKEKDITLSIALRVRDMLNKSGNLTVYLTRESDEFVGLTSRTKMANRLKADLFISIHANAMPGSQKNKDAARGYKVYFLSEAKNEADKLVAMRENAVVELERAAPHTNELSNVLTDLAGNEYLRESQELSILVDRQFEAALGRKIGRLQEGIGQANFWVLNGAYMPSILIETGFVTNSSDEKYLTDRSFQQTMAAAICGAILNFKTKYEKGL
jgi:N-acetylmuramoyl-L-alanine amidase